jgi:hypothetical protein
MWIYKLLIIIALCLVVFRICNELVLNCLDLVHFLVVFSVGVFIIALFIGFFFIFSLKNDFYFSCSSFFICFYMIVYLGVLKKVKIGVRFISVWLKRCCEILPFVSGVCEILKLGLIGDNLFGDKFVDDFLRLEINP